MLEWAVSAERLYQIGIAFQAAAQIDNVDRKRIFWPRGMEITFADNRLQNCCESRTDLRRVYGADCAKKIEIRLADLTAAATLQDFRSLPGRCHELSADRDGQFGLDLAGGKRLVIEPVERPSAQDGDPWAAIDAVRIVEIVDYH